jgi:hypothetical protein
VRHIRKGAPLRLVRRLLSKLSMRALVLLVAIMAIAACSSQVCSPSCAEGYVPLASSCSCVPVTDGGSSDGSATSDRLVDAPSDGLDSADGSVVDIAARTDARATDAECDARTEQTCDGDNLCTALFAWLPESYCANDLSQMTYAGCVPADRTCGAAITWGTDPNTGRTLVFSCTAVPLGWTGAPSGQCPLLDAGGDGRDR